MLFYILTIGLGMIVIAAANILLNPVLYALPVWYIVVAVVASTAAVIAVDGVFAFIIRRLPEKWFTKDKKLFIVSKREMKFYDAIKVVKWKDKVLELGCFTSFSKKKVSDPSENKYVERFILECNYGFIIHAACVVFGFLIIFFYPLSYALMFGVPVAVVNAFLNFLPMCILRFNVPKLNILFKRNERNRRLKEEARQKEHDCDAENFAAREVMPPIGEGTPSVERNVVAEDIN